MKISRKINPIESTDWLADNLENPGLVIVDIRSSQEYLSGHVPGAINIPFPSWIVARDGLTVELPAEGDLFQLIGSAGINSDSNIIVVNKTDHPYPLADAARVCDTLIYVGVENVAILDGGQDKWVREARPLSTDLISPAAVEYRGAVDRHMFVSKDFVLAKIGKGIILDARDPAVYFGLIQEPTAAQAGHIPTAQCCPAPWIWTKEGTYQNSAILKDMAASLAAEPGSQEIIIYCGVGGYTAAWWFILTRMLGYLNVKFYDGSAQDWTRDPAMPVVTYKWE
jgi:thiosulfate/3-mercaptopyruvate sulfurtransferase